MGRKKKNLVNEDVLGSVDKLYLDEYFKHNPRPDWDMLSKQLSKSIDAIQKYANQQDSPPVAPKVEKPRKELTPQQLQLRQTLTPQNNSESEKNRHVTVMSEGASDVISRQNRSKSENVSNKYKSCIHKPS